MLIISPGTEAVKIDDALNFGKIKIIEGCELENIPAGWALIAVILSDTVEQHCGNVPVYEPPYKSNGCDYGGGFNTQYVNNMPLKVRRPSFVIGQLKDETINDLREEVETLNARQAELLESKENIRSDLKEKNSKIGSLKVANKEMAASLEGYAKQVQDLRDQKDLMERHLSLIRKEIGEEKWRAVIEKNESHPDNASTAEKS